MSIIVVILDQDVSYLELTIGKVERRFANAAGGAHRVRDDAPQKLEGG